MRRKCDSAKWSASVWAMRIICPLMFCACVFVAWMAFARGSYFSAMVDAFLAGFNLILGWVQWFVFEPRRFTWKH
jgi:hypothetical protein